jgi:hypothetical protein
MKTNASTKKITDTLRAHIPRRAVSVILFLLLGVELWMRNAMPWNISVMLIPNIAIAKPTQFVCIFVTSFLRGQPFTWPCPVIAIIPFEFGVFALA